MVSRYREGQDSNQIAALMQGQLLKPCSSTNFRKKNLQLLKQKEMDVQSKLLSKTSMLHSQSSPSLRQKPKADALVYAQKTAI